MASYAKRLVCLANSRKISGRCIAGREIADGVVGGWIRPVSSRPTGEVSEEERRYQDGSDPKLLDVIDIWMKEPKPHGFQTENHLIDDEVYWTLVRRATSKELLASVETVTGPLWDDQSSSYNGENDRVAEATAIALGTSLKLIEVAEVTLSVGIEGAAFGNAKRKVRGRFSMNGQTYLLGVTDPLIERQYFQKEDGNYSIGKATLCVSLGDTFHGYAYKLIAGVILPL